MKTVMCFTKYSVVAAISMVTFASYAYAGKEIISDSQFLQGLTTIRPSCSFTIVASTFKDEQQLNYVKVNMADNCNMDKSTWHIYVCNKTSNGSALCQWGGKVDSGAFIQSNPLGK